MSPYRLWLPLGHRLTDAESIALDALAGEQLIVLTVDEIEESTRAMMAALSVRPPIAFRTRSVEAVRSLVATGAGVALLPSLVYRPWSLEGDRIEIRDVSGGSALGSGGAVLAPRCAPVRGGAQLPAIGPRGGDRRLSHRLCRYDLSAF